MPTTDGVIGYERGDDGVVVLTWDDPHTEENAVDGPFATSLHDVVARLYAEQESIAGVVLTSGKATFATRGDLDRLVALRPGDGPRLREDMANLGADLRRLEWFPQPVAAALPGSALGPGLEVALACHFRVCAATPRDGAAAVEIGLSDVTLGLPPGLGGLTRTVRRLGVARALVDVLLTGPRLTPERAWELGLIDEVVPDPAELVSAARRWVLTHPESAGQPWEDDGYEIPGGVPTTDDPMQALAGLPQRSRRTLGTGLYPAPDAIAATAVRAARVDFDAALESEAQTFADVAADPVTANMIQLFHFDLARVRGASAPEPGLGGALPALAGVLGAGMMGSGIAHALARAGIPVVLEDVSADRAQRGKERLRAVLDAQVRDGHLAEPARDAVLGRITTTGEIDRLAGCDLVVEAVFEDPAIKADVLTRAEQVAARGALICSNTSTLPITGLAQSLDEPDRFIGMHFFSPVDKMPLVEVIVGEQTSEASLERARDLVREFGKIAIVVNDSRGFFTSRVFGTMVMEGAGMIAEGFDPAIIERAATTIGFPAPPLAMIDEISLSLCLHIRDTASSAAEAAKLGGFGIGPGLAVVERMVTEFARSGRAVGAGFYDYLADGRKRLWPGLWEHFADPDRGEVDDADFPDLQERLTFAMSIETIRCIEEGVLRSTAEANVGSVLGIGFPGCFGGALQYANNYVDRRPSATLRGVPGFAERARELAAAYGDRFAPPELLERKADSDERF